MAFENCGYLTPHCSACSYWVDNSWDFGCSSHAFNECPYLNNVKSRESTLKNAYEYTGPVMIFDECVEQHWTSTTIAISKRKAKSNLTFLQKKEHGYPINTKVSLPGHINIIEEKKGDR